MIHALMRSRSSHSRGSYSSTSLMWSVVCFKVFECTEVAPIEIHCLLCHARSTHLQEFGWEVFNNNHPSYSSDLAPNDFHLFLHLKKFLSSQRQRFQNDKEAEMRVTVVLIPGGRLLRHSIQTMVPRYNKCLSSGGEYVDKYLNTCCICSNKSFH